MALHALFEQADNRLEGFGLFGVVKETGVDDEGLADFQTRFFPRQIYRDQDHFFFSALGDRKVGLTTFNPVKLVSGFMSIQSRLSKKKIEGNLSGEGTVQGGVIIFGADLKPKYAYYEKTGSEIPSEDILAAVDAVRNGK
uniref:Peroxiredoxin-like 2 activated in M-CSF stimulated monocytes n=1 Tax=Pseudictyota dubia TaxID=2749911 RepID=A0A7R9WEV3_9STRA|mmetsp:Transcript_47726/g.88534  ORF Transcript_47726/g.88534 Transcript_47726/m.88534 type:complete len:140 (+) Transcript_47726:272-691(+)|eukprot:CAMPEP_0197453748 /NCGR_PEP_ID=MMETSP1175-20131217/35929_1 /TAXON_ID=1003142 /ORGANISM="Triceratium dubium, Strain CCMP147" /LENGTH=139 /DNA_ID=CAMNT_0042987131 /DNA_START=337 /DNA_END=756 /DNA_ORIENTATION=-